MLVCSARRQQWGNNKKNKSCSSRIAAMSRPSSARTLQKWAFIFTSFPGKAASPRRYASGGLLRLTPPQFFRRRKRSSCMRWPICGVEGLARRNGNNLGLGQRRQSRGSSRQLLKSTSKRNNTTWSHDQTKKDYDLFSTCHCQCCWTSPLCDAEVLGAKPKVHISLWHGRTYRIASQDCSGGRVASWAKLFSQRSCSSTWCKVSTRSSTCARFGAVWLSTTPTTSLPWMWLLHLPNFCDLFLNQGL